MKRYLPDTNAILNNPSFLETLEGTIYVPYIILQELDKIKMERHTERGLQARQGVRVLKSLDNVVYFTDTTKRKRGFWKTLLCLFKREVIVNNFSPMNNDDRIVDFAAANDCIVVTGDFLMQLKAKARGLKVIEMDKVNAQIAYKGYKRVYLTDEEKAKFYEDKSKNHFGLLQNQYLLINKAEDEGKLDENGNVPRSIDQYVWNGREHVKLNIPDIKNLKAKNDLQMCALDLLDNQNIPIKIIAGNYGSGKTMLSVKVALSHLKKYKGSINRILMVRNPIGAGEEIGFLTGDKDNKTKDFFKPFIQHLEGGEQEAVRLEQQGQLAKEIPFYMKGLSIDNTFIICDEAEDLSEKLVKLVGTRLGEGSVIAFSGDYAQTEGKYMHQNGLLSAIECLKGNPKVGIVILEEDLRSDASKVFADLM